MKTRITLIAAALTYSAQGLHLSSEQQGIFDQAVLAYNHDSSYEQQQAERVKARAKLKMKETLDKAAAEAKKK